MSNWSMINHLSQVEHEARIANAERARHFERDGFSESLLMRIEALLADLIRRDTGEVMHGDIHTRDTVTVPCVSVNR